MNPKSPRPWADSLLWAGLLNALILGIVNPFYISLVLAHLDVRILSVGSCIASALPFLIGLLLERRSWFERAYRWLPVLMVAETVATALCLLVYQADPRAYYLAAMGVFGVLSTSIVYLLQRLKEDRYTGRRAGFERRYAMFDALGYLLGSLLVFAGWIVIRQVWVVLAAGVAQTAGVYGLCMIPYLRHKVTKGVT